MTILVLFRFEHCQNLPHQNSDVYIKNINTYAPGNQTNFFRSVFNQTKPVWWSVQIGLLQHSLRGIFIVKMAKGRH